jgi:predicted DsbA family dithiol-disulfide isomerase
MNVKDPAGVPAPPLTVDVWSDTVCPWCWLGKRRFEAALRERPHLDVVVRWHPFELNAEMPAGGADRREYLQAKFGDPGRFRDAQQRLLDLGRAAGIEYRFDAQPRMPNTRASHALVRLAAGGREGDVVDALFAAYFNAGRDVGDLDVLAALASEAGLDGPAVRARLEAREGYDAIELEEREAQRMGVTGVPFFVFAGKWAVSGAQETEAFVRALDAVSAELAKGAGATA